MSPVFYPQGKMSQKIVQAQSGCVSVVGFKTNSLDDFYIEKQNLIKLLKSNEVLPSNYVAHEQHKGIIERFIGLCKQIVPLVTPVPRKLTEAKVPYLDIQPKDTNEMRKMIDKLNIKTQSFTCNHRKIDEMYYRFEADIGKIYVSDDYKVVEEFFERVAGVIRSVKMDDERLSIKEEESRKAICYTANKRKEEDARKAICMTNKRQEKENDNESSSADKHQEEENEQQEEEDDNESSPPPPPLAGKRQYYDDEDSDDEPSYVYPVTSYGVDITIKNVLEINRRITAINNELIKVAATFESLRCHKCEGIVKEFEVTSKIIERRRREIREEEELAEMMRQEEDEKKGDDKYDIERFLAKHFTTRERILLKDIVTKYEEVTSIHKTLVEMKEAICKYGWKVTCVSKVYYAVRM